MTTRIKTTLEGIINIIDGCSAGKERPTLIKVKERINSIIEDAEAFDASALSAIKEHSELKASKSPESPNAPSDAPKIDDDALRLLILLFHQRGYVPLPVIANELGITIGFLEAHITSLGRFVIRNHESMLALEGVHDGVKIDETGRSFLMKHYRDRL